MSFTLKSVNENSKNSLSSLQYQTKKWVDNKHTHKQIQGKYETLMKANKYKIDFGLFKCICQSKTSFQISNPLLTKNRTFA